MSKPALQAFTRDIMAKYFREKTREILDKEITAMQITYPIVRAGFFDLKNKSTYLSNKTTEYYNQQSWTEEDIQKNYDIFIKAIKNILGNKRISSLDEPPTDLIVRKGSSASVVAVWYYEENNSLLLLAKNFDSIRKVLTKASVVVGKDQPLGYRDVKIGKSGTPNKVSNVDIGHMASYGKEEHNTVLSSKLGKSVKALENSEFKNEQTTQNLIAGLNLFIRALSNIHLEYTASFKKDTTIADKLTALKSNPNIGKFSFIMTIPQFWELNQILINDRELQAYFSAEELFDSIIDQESSPPLSKMLMDVLLYAFQGMFNNGKKFTTKASGTLDIPTNISISNNKLTNLPVPQLRSASGKFFNVLKLQNLINSQLHDRLRANMGTGGDKNTLNYITGRFAKSAKVLSINQRGLGLDTYFTYMKYPYETFAPGGKQYKGDRRDPEKLIGRSIREIAINLVSGQFMIRPIVG